MKLGRKIKKIKKAFLYFLKYNININLYNFIILQLSKKKFLQSKNRKKVILKKALNLDSLNNYEYKISSQNNEDGIIEYLESHIINPDKLFF